MLKCAAILLALSGYLSATEPNKSIAMVYVSAPMREGFVDTGKDIQDSVKDVRSHLSTMKEFRIVESPSDADLVLTVVMRGVGSESYGQRISYSEYGGP